MFDYSSAGSMDDMISNVDRSQRESMWTSEEMLRYAWQISAALVSIHNVGSRHGSAAIAHTDVDTDQILWMNGMFKVSLK